MNHATYQYPEVFSPDSWKIVWMKLVIRLSKIDDGALNERNIFAAIVKIGPKFKAFYTRLKQSDPQRLIIWSDMCDHSTEHAELDTELRQEWKSFPFDPKSRTKAQVRLEKEICSVNGIQET